MDALNSIKKSDNLKNKVTIQTLNLLNKILVLLPQWNCILVVPNIFPFSKIQVLLPSIIECNTVQTHLRDELLTLHNLFFFLNLLVLLKYILINTSLLLKWKTSLRIVHLMVIFPI